MSDYTKSEIKKKERKKAFRDVESYLLSLFETKGLSKHQKHQLKKLIKSVQKDNKKDDGSE